MTIPLPRYKDLIGGIMLNQFCNIFGDHTNGAKVYMGGLGDASTVEKQWYCPNISIGRYRMVCEHGHRGQVMKLCAHHFRQFRDSVTFCPRCNQDENNGHKCNLRLEGLS